MTWSKNTFIKAGFSLAAFLVACSDDSSSKAEPSDVVLREVSTIYDLGACIADRYGDTVFVNEKAVDYLCVDNDWVDITTPSGNQSENPENGLSSFTDVSVLSSSSFIDDPIRNDSNSVIPPPINQDYAVVAVKEKLPRCGSANAKRRILVQTDSVIYTCLSEKWVPDDSKGYVIKDASILGAAQKGPFKVKSSLLLSEVFLRNDTLIYSGRKYSDEISSNKGDFVIPKVSLIYPYAVLEVRGQWRNEISGEYSRDSMTLRVLTDLSNRTEVNINLLTHFEYDRAVRLVSNGYSVYAAKTQAEHEIMAAFGFETTVEYSEDLKTFVPSTDISYDANATLMAISLLFIANKNEADIQKSINDFRSDFAEDGSWDNEQMKANMADWAATFDGGSIRTNVKKWNILNIPSYERYLAIFWNNAYGLGGCDQSRYGIILRNSNKLSKKYKTHYICKETGWRKATDYEKDTYKWKNGTDGEVKQGDVTSTYYVFENGKWTTAKNEATLGICTTKRNGELAKIDTVYLICKNEKWVKATVIEYDTYQFDVGTEGEVHTGKVNESNYYVYENGTWRASKNEIENNLGACVTSRLGEVGLAGSSYYTCKTGGWNEASVLEYDTYGWSAGKDGEMRAGIIDTTNHYIFENGIWRTSENELEYYFGLCVARKYGEKIFIKDKYYICAKDIKNSRDYWKEITAEEYELGFCADSNYKEVKKLDEMYYICKTGWTVATTVEYDTYGYGAGSDGEARPGRINKDKFYVYDRQMNRWRTARNELEEHFGACVIGRENEKNMLVKVDSVFYYICENKNWEIISEFEYEHIRCNDVNEGVLDSTDDGLNKEYYICKSSQWMVATALEYDTYGWKNGKNGEVREGSRNPLNHYVYDKTEWRSTENDLEYAFGICVSRRKEERFVLNGYYYVCTGYIWKQTDIIEYDTYGNNCLSNGSIVSGIGYPENKYVCDSGEFREANDRELYLGKGCVSYTNNTRIRRNISEEVDSIYACKNGLWEDEYIIYGLLTDDRDKKTYKTVTINGKTWMAENLNYADSSDYPNLQEYSWCYDNEPDNCAKYGRLYIWSLAMDSVGIISSNGKNCGEGTICSPIYPVRGICPEGWHLPDTTEWQDLYNATGNSSYTLFAQKTSASASDDYSFSVFPAGIYVFNEFSNFGNNAYFWSANDGSNIYASEWFMYVNQRNASVNAGLKNSGHSVRCVKD